MSEHFDKPDEYNDGAFITIRFNDILPPDHKARYIKTFIDNIDVSGFEEKYKVGTGQKGRPPKDVKMMLCVILYAIYRRINSARQIDYATYNYADFWLFTHQKRISHDKISDFINIHQNDIKAVFLETIIMAEKNKLLNFEAVFQDGFLMKANASIKKNKNLYRLKKKEKKLEELLEEVLSQLRKNDKDEDELKKKSTLNKELEKIKKLQSKLNERIKIRSSQKGPSAVKKMQDTMSINETDSDSEFSKMKDGSRRNAYLKVCATDSEADIIVGSNIQGHCDEKHMLRNLTKDVNQNCKDLGGYDTVVADSNFITMGNCVGLEASGIDLIGPTQRHETEQRNKEKYKNAIKFNHDEENNCIICSEGIKLDYKGRRLDSREGTLYLLYSNEEACKICKKVGDCTKSKKGFREVKVDARYPTQERALNRYKSEEGQLLYEKRRHTAEVFQGDLQHNGRFRQFFRNGIKKVMVDSIFHDITWNLRRIFNSRGENIAW